MKVINLLSLRVIYSVRTSTNHHEINVVVSSHSGGEGHNYVTVTVARARLGEHRCRLSVLQC